MPVHIFDTQAADFWFFISYLITTVFYTRSRVIYFLNLVKLQPDKYENAPSERSSIWGTCKSRFVPFFLHQ
jgi:hypothetical protein